MLNQWKQKRKFWQEGGGGQNSFLLTLTFSEFDRDLATLRQFKANFQLIWRQMTDQTENLENSRSKNCSGTYFFGWKFENLFRPVFFRWKIHSAPGFFRSKIRSTPYFYWSKIQSAPYICRSKIRSAPYTVYPLIRSLPYIDWKCL